MKHSLITHAGSCPVARTAQLVGDEWTLLIIRDVLSGPKRFNQLQESLGSVSPKTLSHRLKLLESQAILRREVFPEIPPHVEYSLTEKGQALSDVIEAMRTFGSAYLMGAD